MWAPPPSAQNLYIPKGIWLFDRYDINGLPTGFRDLGEVSGAEETTADDKVAKYSSRSAAAPKVAEVMRRRDINFRLTLDEFHPDNMALLTMGDVATLVQAGTAVVAEPVSLTTIPGLVYGLLKAGPYTAVAVKFGAGTGVQGVDWDFLGPPAAGQIKISDTTILAGAVTVDYTPTAYAGAAGPQVVSGGKAATIKGAARFIGDPTLGPTMVVDIFTCNISPEGGVPWIGTDFTSAAINLAVLETKGKSSPWQIRYLK